MFFCLFTPFSTSDCHDVKSNDYVNDLEEKMLRNGLEKMNEPG